MTKSRILFHIHVLLLELVCKHVSIDFTPLAVVQKVCCDVGSHHSVQLKRSSHGPFNSCVPLFSELLMDQLPPEIFSYILHCALNGYCDGPVYYIEAEWNKSSNAKSRLSTFFPSPVTGNNPYTQHRLFGPLFISQDLRQAPPRSSRSWNELALARRYTSSSTRTFKHTAMKGTSR